MVNTLHVADQHMAVIKSFLAYVTHEQWCTVKLATKSLHSSVSKTKPLVRVGSWSAQHRNIYTIIFQKFSGILYFICITLPWYSILSYVYSIQYGSNSTSNQFYIVSYQVSSPSHYTITV